MDIVTNLIGARVAITIAAAHNKHHTQDIRADRTRLFENAVLGSIHTVFAFAGEVHVVVAWDDDGHFMQLPITDLRIVKDLE